MRRVVVTGLGMVTPLGCGVEPTWKRLLRGESGAGKIDSFDVSDIACKIACEIPRGDGTNATFNPDQWMEPKEQRKVDEFILFAMCAARQALDDAGWRPTSYDEQTTTGVLIGSGIGGIEGIAEAAVQFETGIHQALVNQREDILRLTVCASPSPTVIDFAAGRSESSSAGSRQASSPAGTRSAGATK